MDPLATLTSADDLGPAWDTSWVTPSFICLHLLLTVTVMPPKKPTGNAVQAEVALHQSLKNCLVNLPSTLVSVLVNANAVRLYIYIPQACVEILTR